MNKAEVEKYRRCYAKSSYRMGKRRRQRMEKDLCSVDRDSSLLDVGAGRGETVQFAKDLGMVAFGIEIVPELCGFHVLHASIESIPFENIDVVTCYDMLEHLPPDSVEKGLDELFRVAKTQLFLTVSGNHAENDDDTLHLSVHDADWWYKQFRLRSSTATISTTTYCTDKDWHFAITL